MGQCIDMWPAYVTVSGKTGHNAACVNIEKRSIDFLKMYYFKPTVWNGQVYYSGNDLSYDDKTWRAQYLDADDSVSAKKNFSKEAALCLVFLYTVTYIYTKIALKQTQITVGFTFAYTCTLN